MQMALLGQFQFFPGGSGLSFWSAPKPRLEPKQGAVEIALDEGKYPSALVEGFNAAEPWGRWTSRVRSSIELPFAIRGRIRVAFFGWTLSENRTSPLVVRAGTASATVDLPAVGSDHVVTLDVDQPTDRLEFESPVFRPEGSGRVLGTALARISVEAL